MIQPRMTQSKISLPHHIDIDHYDELPPEASPDNIVPLPMPSDADLDRLFLDDSAQRERLAGLPICQGGGFLEAVVRGIQGRYKVARLAEAVPIQGPPPNAERVFSDKELACYPEDGTYIIIRGGVYDMTLCIEDYDYLRIGRVVQEIAVDQLARHEVAVNRMVYDLRPLGDWEGMVRNRILLGDVLDGAGTDISHRLRVPQPCPGMLRLLQRRDLIVAKLESLVDVYPDELAAADGSEIPAPSRTDDLGAPSHGPDPDRRPVWISRAGEVYDMTYERGWIDEWKGQEAPPSPFAIRLAQSHRCRIFGTLMSGYHARPADLKRPALRDDNEDADDDSTFDPDRNDGRIKRGRIDWTQQANI
ncbi:hypothetical protein J7T55_000451 [Diaporthe amygdali]|uniref:uncharacterized protein n=1 Tax=Phomopsis amygdali TaxID=1214568 RepID=UPI0022FF17D8|nr:uncharacterized protein J7T55_000451 [Diaporthe amygdali]KAJ0103824.1 hypothetical protein J7T55_000451 [Diaporthe amygdali]